MCCTHEFVYRTGLAFRNVGHNFFIAQSCKGMNTLTTLQVAPPTPENVRLAVIGLGYVGLPLAVAFGRKLPTVGFDISAKRVEALRQGVDLTRETARCELETATQLSFTTAIDDLRSCNVFIVTVPTPIDSHRRPDLQPLISASTTIGKVLQPGSVIVYESTVYPGATEEDCVPVLEAVSGRKCNEDFFVGYSPERINPGDKQHRLANITKVIAGSTEATADLLESLYCSIVDAGVHRAPSIRVAEAAKVIENTQRDLNIALINELSLIFERLNIDTEDVLNAARTKWNFLDFRPGLVGGHCIGVDPYYLTHKAQAIGYHPEVILAGRRINDGMGEHIADRVIKLMAQNRIELVGARVLIMGLAFKENCPDIRNTRVVDVARAFEQYHLSVDIYDPWVRPEDAKKEYGLELIEQPQDGMYDAIVLAVAHDEFRTLDCNLLRYAKRQRVLFDVKHALPRELATARL